ncbi:unnamed protein product [Ilex paraguariensis]|uniref:B-like cyclin n=1 Tax=Ilex paraguariensis TaxID=185542 RepID=A0ABC8SWX0_9AQUA
MELDLENPFPTFHDHHFDTITSLFNIESDHMPSKNYPENLKATDFDISIRRETISLILHVSHNSDSSLSYLAINYLDRFLSTQSIPEGKPWILRLLALCCVSLALKMRKTEFFVSDIQQDGGFMFDAQTIQRMELLILGALKWRMRSVTPFSFVSFFISLFKFKDPPLRQALKARATEIIFKAQNEIKLLEFKPSILAASALLSASHELFPLQFPCFRKAISNCPHVNKESLFSCCNMIKEIAMDGYESVLEMVSRSSTPVNVLDLPCSSSSSSSDSEKANPTEGSGTGTIRLEKDLKRRKIGGFRGDNTFQLSQIQQC